MKNSTIIFFLMLSYSFFAQGPRQLTAKEINEINLKVDKEANNLRSQMEKDNSSFSINKNLEIEFQIDTFKIEQKINKRLEVDYSTAGMLAVIYFAKNEYDQLLNKYYQLLLIKLDNSDKEILKEAQRNWIKYRDSEINLIETLSEEEYSGGGTLQSVTVSSEIMDLTKQRTIELYTYLVQIIEN